ncbi:MAG: DUF4115 domain-containing protein [Halieaceae bacterium]|nr:DUF4115 domain-containing protein [Halieaceae bacterium]
MENSEIPEPALEKPGDILRQARQELGISQSEIAERMYLKLSDLVALEENRFEVLKGGVFARGYLIAFARLVEVDTDRVVSAYDRLPSVIAASAENQPVKSSSIARTQKTGAAAVPAGIGLFVLLLLLLWWLQRSEMPWSDPAEQAPVVAETGSMMGVEPVVSGPDSSESAVEGDLETDSEPSVAESPESAGSSEPPGPAESIASSEAFESQESHEVVESQESHEVVEPLEPLEPLESPATDESMELAVDSQQELETLEPTPADPEEPLPGRVINAGSEQGALLEFSFSGECWAEVYDSSNELIYQDLHREGDQVTVRGAAPFTILFGDSRYVELLYQGNSVDIVPRRGDVVARMVVGES